MTELGSEAKQETGQKVCLNCGECKPDSDPYCKNCGQRHTRLNDGLEYFVGDFLTSFLSVDGRAFRTVTTLLFKPGKCALDFLNGRRSYYLSTSQIYLVSGFFFFLVFSNWVDVLKIEELLTIDSGSEKRSLAELNRGLGLELAEGATSDREPSPDKETVESDPPADGQSPREDAGEDGQVATQPEATTGDIEPGSSAIKPLDPKPADTHFFNQVQSITFNGKQVRFSIAQFRQFSMLPKSEIAQFFRAQEVELSPFEIDVIKKLALLTTDHGLASYVSGSIGLASQMALLMLPLLAVLLRLSHWRSCRSWLAAFVVSAQLHSSMYIALSVLMLLQLSFLWVAGLGLGVGAFFWFWTLRRVFGQSWVMILVKTVFLLPLYGFGLQVAVSAAVLGSIFLF